MTYKLGDIIMRDRQSRHIKGISIVLFKNEDIIIKYSTEVLSATGTDGENKLFNREPSFFGKDRHYRIYDTAGIKKIGELDKKTLKDLVIYYNTFAHDYIRKYTDPNSL